MIYYIADLHLGHRNVIKFDNRPFGSVEENDEAIIERWNNTVADDDTVWILGDIGFGSAERIVDVYGSLKGHKKLIIGNHDEKLLRNAKVRNLFEETKYYTEITDYANRKIVLCHYPIPCFKNHYYGAYHLYGHVHSGKEFEIMEKTKRALEEALNMPCNMFNVGCMMPYVNYTPVTMEDILSANYER